MEFTPQELGSKDEKSFSEQRREYNLLMKKYREQQKMLNSLKKSEKLEIREHFKHLTQAGRRRKYTPLTMKNKIIDYFATIQAKNRPPTISGLMTHLKMHRDQFYTYANYPEFKDIMEQTRNMMENWYEESLVLGKYNGSGIQFALKNRFGWTDTQTIRHEEVVDEKQLIAKIESLAPELALVFQQQGLRQLEMNTVEGEVI